MPRCTRACTALVALPLLLAVACGPGGEAGGGATSTTAPTATTAPASPTSAPLASVATTTTTDPRQVVTASFQGGRVDGPGRARVTLNRPVVVRVTSDVADEVHVHAYDHRTPVGPGQPAELTFVATIPGVFEVELERVHRVLFLLEVR